MNDMEIIEVNANGNAVIRNGSVYSRCNSEFVRIDCDYLGDGGFGRALGTGAFPRVYWSIPYCSKHRHLN